MRLFRYAQVFNASTTLNAPWNLAFAPEVYTWGESGTAGTSTHGTRSGAGSGAGAFGGEPAWAGLAPGQLVTITVPQGSTGNPTTVAAAGLVTVQANAGLAPVTTTGGLGGTAGANTIAFAGGAGANAISGSSVNGGAGGGSAGSTGAGGAAVTSTGGTAGPGAAGPPSLAGVAGQSGPGALAAGLNGTAPGGGASGGGSGGTINHGGGTGAPGQAVIIWTVWVPEGSFRGRPSAARGRSASSPGSPVVSTSTTPATFRPPSSASRGRPADTRGRSASSPGSKVIPPAPSPAPFHPPARAPRGAPGARRGRAPSGSSSPGSPVSPTPAPFHPPARAPRGAPGARRGRAPSGSSSPGSPVTPGPTPKILLISLASAAGIDDYGNAYPQGINATAGVIAGPTLIGSSAFYYSPSEGFGNLTQSISENSGTDQFGNAYIAGTATYLNAGSFWAAVVISGGTVDWYKASTAAGPWTFEAEIGFAWNALTGGALIFNAPAGFGGTVGAAPFQIPVPTPTANVAAIINALQLAGIFQ